MDSHLEEKVHKSIEKNNQDYGLIAIAHQLSTIENADIIHTLKDGKIVEKGKHKELIQKEEVYYNLYKTQQTGKER